MIIQASPQKVRRETNKESQVDKQRILLKDHETKAAVCLWGSLIGTVSTGDVIRLSDVNPYTFCNKAILTTTASTKLEVIPL